jgi:hypothetical protein
MVQLTGAGWGNSLIESEEVQKSRATRVRPARDVIYDLVEECIETSGRLNQLMGLPG